LKPGGVNGPAVLEAQAVLVADPVGGRQHGLGEPRALLQDALEQVAVEVLAAERAVVLLEIEHFMDHETDVTEGGAVGVHGLSFLFGLARFYARDCRGAP
jgi:hypothetical protein